MELSEPERTSKGIHKIKNNIDPRSIGALKNEDFRKSGRTRITEGNVMEVERRLGLYFSCLEEGRISSSSPFVPPWVRSQGSLTGAHWPGKYESI